MFNSHKFYTILTLFLLFGVLVAPLFASAGWFTSLINRILDDIRSLQKEVEVLEVEVKEEKEIQRTDIRVSLYCPTLSRNLYLGINDSAVGGEVTELQKFLAEDSDVYPEGLITGYFGSLTEKALKRWQAKYNVVSSGSPNTTGYGVVGPKTRDKIQEVCADESVIKITIPIAAVNPFIALYSLNNGEDIKIGDDIKIKWYAHSMAEDKEYTLRIDLIDGPGAHTIALVPFDVSKSQSGEYNWNLSPTFLANGYEYELRLGNYKIRLVLFDRADCDDECISATSDISSIPNDESDTTFSIKDASDDSETITEPSGAATLTPDYVISNVKSVNLGGGITLITWSVNRDATSKIEYGLTEDYGLEKDAVTILSKNHSVILSGLEEKRVYNFKIKTRDKNGGQIESGGHTFISQDITPPSLDVTISNITGTSIDVRAETNEASAFLIEYGKSTSYGKIKEFDFSSDDDYTTSIDTTVKNLDHGTTYHARVKAWDLSDNIIYSDDIIFNTPLTSLIFEVNPFINLTGWPVGQSALISWQTNLSCKGEVRYGPSESYGGSASSNKATSHTVMISGLELDTLYYGKITCLSDDDSVESDGFVFGTGNPPSASVEFHQAKIDGDDLSITFTKNFGACVNLVDENGWSINYSNYFCVQGSNVNIAHKLSDFNVTVGQRLKLCHADNSSVCSEFLDIK